MSTTDLPVMQQLDGTPASHRITRLIASTLFILTLLLYGRAIFFQFVGYDDYQYIVDNLRVRQGLNFATAHWALTHVFFTNYSPLTILTQLATSSIFGTGPAGFHAVNIALHACNVVLLFEFLRRSGGMISLAAVGAAVWGWHPLRVESVAWVSELKDVLCGTFWLLAMLAHLRYVRRGKPVDYLLVLLSYTASLASKPMAVSLPFVLLLLDVYPIRRFAADQTQSRRRRMTVAIVEKLPMLALAAQLARSTLSAQLNSVQHFQLSTRLKNAIVSIASYLRDTLFARKLTVFYPHPQMIGRVISTSSVVASIAVLLVVTAAAVYLAYKHRPGAVIGWLWFLGSLVPVIGLVQVGEQARADRYTYLPSIGLIAAVVWTLSFSPASGSVATDFFEKSTSRRRYLPFYKSAITVGLAVLILLLLEISGMEVQLSTWRNSASLFTHAVQVTDQNYLAYGELANVDLQDHHFPQALALADRALEIRPNSKYGLITRAMALMELHRLSDSLKALRSASEVDPFNAVLHQKAASVLVQMQRYDPAEKQFRQSLQFNNDDPITHDDYAALLATQGHFDEARAQWRIAIALDPTFANARANLAQTAQMQGDTATALSQYKVAVRLAGKDAKPVWMLNLAWLEATSPGSSPQDIDDAVAKATAAVPNETAASPLELDTLAAALARAAQFDRAAAVAERAVREATAQRNEPLADSIRNRLISYQHGQPYIAAR